MGNTNSSADFECSIAVKDYKVVKKVKDRHLGEVTHMKNQKTSDMVLMKDCEATDQETYHKMVEDYSYYTTLKHKNLAIVYGFTGADNHELFKNSSYRVGIYFEYLQNTLESVLLKRKMQTNSTSKQGNSNSVGYYYSELELFQLMSQLVDLLEYLQQNGVSHGEIRPSSCFVDNEGQFKLYNRRLLCDGETAFQKAKNGDTNLFLTPTEFENIGKQKQEPLQNKYKADVFSLGMTFLECATLKKSSQLYDWNNHTINLNILSARLIDIKQRYSTFIYDTLREMVSFDEEKRPDFITLKHCLEEEGKANLSLVSVYTIPDEDHVIKDLVLDMNPQTMVPTHEQTSHDQGGLYNTFFQKSIAHSGSSKVEPKILPNEETPRLTKETVLGGSIPSTFREENIPEDLLESNANLKINEMQGQALQPVLKKFTNINSDLTSILMQRNSENNNKTADKHVNPPPAIDTAQKKHAETEPNVILQKEYHDIFQTDLKSYVPKDREFSALKYESPLIQEIFSTPKKEVSKYTDSVGYSTVVYGSDSSPYGHIPASYQSSQYYDIPKSREYSPEKTKPKMIDQIVRDSLDRARRCRESLHKRDERAILPKDILNSSTATFGEENHPQRERESINERLHHAEYRYQTEIKRTLPKPPLHHHHNSVTKDALNREYLELLNKCKNAKKEATRHWTNADMENHLLQRHKPYRGTPDFLERNARRSLSNSRSVKKLAERYEAYMPVKTEKNYSPARKPIQRTLTFGSPERERDYSPQYDTKPEISRKQFSVDNSPWENYSSTKFEKRRHSHITPLLEEADDTFDRAMQRTELTREYIRKSDARSRSPPLPRRTVHI